MKAYFAQAFEGLATAKPNLGTQAAPTLLDRVGFRKSRDLDLSEKKL